MTRPSKIVLVYHGIGDNDRFLEVSENSFKKQINYLIDRDFSFLFLEDLLKSSTKSVTLVFDDGLKSVLKVKNFLEDKNIPFALSLINKELDSEDGKYLKISDLLKFKNCEFYSHSSNHMDLTKLFGSKLEDEVASSKYILERWLNRQINCFVYPFGKCNQEVLKMVEKAGYKSALGLLPFHLSYRSNVLCLPRLNINSFVNFNKFKFFVSKLGNLYLHLAFIKRKILGQGYLN